MTTCAILSCNNHNCNESKGVTFHRFPRDPFIREKWISLCGRLNWVPSKSSRICSEHFLQEEVIKKKKYTYIKRNAIPRKNIVIRKYMFDGGDDGDDGDEPEAVDVAKSTSNIQEVIVIPDDTETVLSHPQKSDTTKDTEANFITVEKPSTPVEENKLVSNINIQITPRIKRLLQLLELKESKIKQQDAEIKQLQGKNVQLQNNGVVLRHKLKTIDEQFNMGKNLLIQLESTDSPVNFDSTIFHVKEESMQT